MGLKVDPPVVAAIPNPYVYDRPLAPKAPDIG
jgi:hypothetical protein